MPSANDCTSQLQDAETVKLVINFVRLSAKNYQSSAADTT